ncbi:MULTISPECIES: acylneuraminate cytidylyltransferase family protein [Bradyrhizobium]|jgi:CMP-N,N'-diacetyllegionaminic acid synthase|uniref:Acylneuraminate cytidylyltransferase family protein n=1 Tax=Bradyrhizobium ottawaense TaxID=931866 RepID=A0A2U8PB03_9BRAD|nr:MULTISPECIES: acylneuraminate cytidylyltransferase family protein [Bradyrhizobium]GMP00056.1 acylneuraminate cytidylyltransferase family protein [Bradyrhizobium sp. TM239]AWL94949.1 acylneuraminate cytidylyltransferase family protein [Bradyrhizobium ottawaense]MBR1324526.1 acylneuraminate cytidylyltransferase family protein [Bradyrhizobium ottawaense]MBR1332692.1 acylneuraminate cytidylyltransferase family protein [Bradyrhizobium ottawaense]MDA9450474.1 acylneuraminate cytidylyltransferase 
MARKTLAVIAARGGSKGIPHKNLLDLCGKPLIAWTVEQARAARGVDVVAVSSDSDQILAAAEAAGAVGVRRPDDISGDLASSESAWLHALDATDARMGRFERIVALQATSPIREPGDIENALATFDRDHLDSLLSVCEVEDYFNWHIGANGPEPINYDYRNRRMRQQIEKRYLENGSFYVLIPSLLREQNNRLGGKIGFHVMERHKMFQIDRPEDVKLCAAIMRSYGYA